MEWERVARRAERKRVLPAYVHKKIDYTDVEEAVEV